MIRWICYNIQMEFFRFLAFMGFIDKPEGGPFGFQYFRWDFWNSECSYSIWSDRFIWTNQFKLVSRECFNKMDKRRVNPVKLGI